MTQPPDPNQHDWTSGSGARGNPPHGMQAQPGTGGSQPQFRDQPPAGAIPPDQHPQAPPNPAPGAHGSHPGNFPGAITPEKPPVSTWLKVVRYIVLAIIVGLTGLGLWAMWSDHQGIKALEEGNCVVMSGNENSTSQELVDCADAETISYEVVKVIDGLGSCPSAMDWIMVSKSSRGGSGNDVEKVACIIPNFHAGQCWSETDDVMGFELTDCSPGVVKVTSVIPDGMADCEPDEWVANYPEADRTYCLAEV